MLAGGTFQHDSGRKVVFKVTKKWYSGERGGPLQIRSAWREPPSGRTTLANFAVTPQAAKGDLTRG
jgi:hypothetical protein